MKPGDFYRVIKKNLIALVDCSSIFRKLPFQDINTISILLWKSIVTFWKFCEVSNNSKIKAPMIDDKNGVICSSITFPCILQTRLAEITELDNFVALIKVSTWNVHRWQFLAIANDSWRHQYQYFQYFQWS